MTLPLENLYSIIMPAWNVEQYIGAAIESVVSQSYTNWELVIVDDGSTDATPTIIRRWKEKYNRIKVVTQSNKGLSAARNAGMDAACGNWIIFLDSDDFVHPELLHKLECAKTDTPNADMLAYTAISFADGTESQLDYTCNKTDPFYGREYLDDRLYSASEYYELMCQHNNFVSSACLYAVKRGILSDHKLTFREGLLHEDELFTRELIFSCDTIRFIPEALYLRRNREGSITRSKPGLNKILSFIRIAGELNALSEKHANINLSKDASRLFQNAVKVAEAHHSGNLRLFLCFLFSPLFTGYPAKKRIFRLLIARK